MLRRFSPLVGLWKLKRHALYISAEVKGAYLPNTKLSPPRGIVRAQSPCWCEEDDFGVVCFCWPNHNQIDNSEGLPPKDLTLPISTEHTKSTVLTSVSEKSNTSGDAFVYSVVGTVLAKTLTDIDGTSTAFYNNTAPGQLIGKSYSISSENL